MSLRRMRQMRRLSCHHRKQSGPYPNQFRPGNLQRRSASYVSSFLKVIVSLRNYRAQCIFSQVFMMDKTGRPGAACRCRAARAAFVDHDRLLAVIRALIIAAVPRTACRRSPPAPSWRVRLARPDRLICRLTVFCFALPGAPRPTWLRAIEPPAAKPHAAGAGAGRSGTLAGPIPIERPRWRRLTRTCNTRLRAR
jgi:hypothetical protein